MIGWIVSSKKEAGLAETLSPQEDESTEMRVFDQRYQIHSTCHSIPWVPT